MIGNIEKLLAGLKWADRKLFRNLFKREAVDFNSDGSLLKVGGLYGVSGRYILGDGTVHNNTITAEGQLYLLSTGLAGGTAEAAWYLALWNGGVAPAESWTATSFSTTAGEIVSATEGYSEATRPQWVPDTPLAEPMSNSASPAQFTIVTATTLTIGGAALISSSGKGATTGILMSAAAFSPARTHNNGDIFSVIYEESLQPL